MTTIQTNNFGISSHRLQPTVLDTQTTFVPFIFRESYNPMYISFQVSPIELWDCWASPHMTALHITYLIEWVEITL